MCASAGDSRGVYRSSGIAEGKIGTSHRFFLLSLYSGPVQLYKTMLHELKHSGKCGSLSE